MTRLRFALAGASFKAAQLPYVPQWVRASWLLPSFDRLTRDGYASNAAVYACVAALAFAFQEAPLVVTDEADELLPAHPLQRLLRRPNPMMGQKELANISMVYMAVGGQAYWHKVRNNAGQVVELWPYHAGHMLPVPGGENGWISHYEYSGRGETVRVEAADIVHLRWPLPDLEQPWLAMPPLRAVAREVDADSEATRYMYALLVNDAMPRTAIQMPEGVQLSDVQFDRLRQQWGQRHGGANRGGVALLEGGAQIQRLSLNLQELAFDALRRVPETRIAAALRVPAIIAGLNAGLERSTYSNFEEARKQFTENTLVPLWGLVADEIEHDLGQEFGGGVTVRHDLHRVAALQDNENERYTRVVLAWEKGVMTRNEARRALGLADAEGEIGEAYATATAAAPALPVTVEDVPPRLPAPKGGARVVERKAAPRSFEEAATEREVLEELKRQYRRAAELAGELVG